MTTIRKDAQKKIDEAFSNLSGFQKTICLKLRKLIHETLPDIKEDWKWGPNFNHHGMICGIWGFKEHVSFVFFNGGLMKDSFKLFTDGHDNSRNRMIKFFSGQDLSPQLIRQIAEYLRESALINEKSIKPVAQKRSLTIPTYFRTELHKKKLEKKFTEFTKTKQYDYIEWITQAKREETRKAHIEKALELIAKGIGLNDKYLTKREKVSKT